MASGAEEPNVHFNFNGSLTLIAFVWLVVTGPDRRITAVPTFVTSSLDLVSPSTPHPGAPSTAFTRPSAYASNKSSCSLGALAASPCPQVIVWCASVHCHRLRSGVSPQSTFPDLV